MAINFKSRAFQLPGIVFLFLSFILLFIVSLSLPYLTDLDFVRVHFKEGSSTVGNNTDAITDVRFGTWAACWYQQNGNRVCNTNHGGYSTTLYDAHRASSVTVGASWTRGLAIHPIATAVTVVALGLSCLTHAGARLAAAIAAFLAAFLTLIAFLADIALYGWVKREVGKLEGVESDTATGPGFWITFIVLLLLSCAGCTVCLGRRRDRADGAKTYPYSWAQKDRSTAAGRSAPPAPGTRRVPPAPPGRGVPPTTELETEKETETKPAVRTVPPRLPPRTLQLKAAPATKAE